MKKLIFFIPALILFSVSCEKEENSPSQIENEPDSEVKMITEVVSGGRGDATKATIGSTTPTFAWTAGDNVAVHVSNGKYVYTSDDGASGATPKASPDKASFTVVYPDGYSRDAFALYPSTIVDKDATKYGQSEQSLDVTLPSSYTLAQVSGETSPCPMISTNTTGAGWVFYQLCGLLRLTVNDIPATAKRLEIDFNGKNVAGKFAIPDPVKGDGTSTIALDDADGSNSSVITITKDGSEAVLGATSLVLNFPLPAGSYEKITVIAYNALTGGSALSGATINFAYSADNSHATKKTATLGGSLQSTFNFTFKSGATTLEDVRFARVFSVKNKLHNTTSYGPYTASANTDLNSHEHPAISADLYFDKVSDDQLVFQVITSDGKVYSGIYDAPADGYDLFKTYDVTADVKAYTFTVASSGTKVYFSPGDLGVDSNVYSFTEPFTAWNQTSSYMTTKGTPASKRTWFIRDEVKDGHKVYGIDWRIQNYASEWKYLVGLDAGRRIDNGNVSLYYIVHINTQEFGDRYWCYLLPPDEATYDDIEDDLRNKKGGTDYYEVTNYLKYIAKGFVLLMDTDYSRRYSSTGNWSYQSGTHAGYYQAGYVNSSKTYFSFSSSGPAYNANQMGTDQRIHVRYIHGVTP
jgi:hypothetical protein